MKILCLIPPYIPSYFNAGHHLPIFQVASYLRHYRPEHEIVCVDAAALNQTWKELCGLLIKDFDLIAVLNDFDSVDTFERFHYYRTCLSARTKTITFGRLSKQIPRFFFQFCFDAIVASGDYEAGVLAYVDYLQGITAGEQLFGVLLRSNVEPCAAGIYLNPDTWILPQIQEIPYTAYNFMYKNDLNKFCGIPQRTELVVPVARGCSVNCQYCDVPSMQGKIERRLSVEKTLLYIQASFDCLPFDYISFYAPTFTLNQKWVRALCHGLLQLPRRYPWKCVTVLKTLNEELIRLMGASGCVRISLGIESFTHTAALGLPKIKQDTLKAFTRIVNFCRDADIELNCFIMLGLPGDTPHDVKQTMDICFEQGARVRPTIYTPYHWLTNEMTVAEVSHYNRQLFPPGYLSAEQTAEYYKIFYDNQNDRETRVMEAITQR